MKVLFIGVSRDATGWGNSAIDYMRALDSVGVDVVSRPIKLNKRNAEVPSCLIDFEQKSPTGSDAVIQYILPHMMDYNGRIPKNIAMYTTETDNFKGIRWADKINCMDEAWVLNRQSVQASKRSGVNVPLKVIPCACDTSKYERNYKPLSIRQRLGDAFVFYYIGEFNRRKNIAAIIQAFHLEFDINEPVHLLLKTISTTGTSEHDDIEAHTTITEVINDAKKAMQLYATPEHYKQEILIVSNYNEEDIMRLHSTCDCFVCPSYGEAWCIPAFDAMAMGKTPIVTDIGGFAQYMTVDTGWLLPHRLEPVFGMHHNSIPGMFSARENWASVEINALRKAMRVAYEDKNLRFYKAATGMERAYDFSYKKVGNLMRECLNDES